MTLPEAVASAPAIRHDRMAAPPDELVEREVGTARPGATHGELQGPARLAARPLARHGTLMTRAAETLLAIRLAVGVTLAAWSWRSWLAVAVAALRRMRVRCKPSPRHAASASCPGAIMKQKIEVATAATTAEVPP